MFYQQNRPTYLAPPCTTIVRHELRRQISLVAHPRDMDCSYFQMGFPKMGVTPRWLVYKGESYLKWMILWDGTPILGNLQRFPTIDTSSLRAVIKSYHTFFRCVICHLGFRRFSRIWSSKDRPVSFCNRDMFLWL